MMTTSHLFYARRAAFDVDYVARFSKRHDVAREWYTVDPERERPTIVVPHADPVFRPATLAHHRVIRQLGAHAGLDQKSIVFGPDAQDVLRDGDKVPGRRAGQPGILGFAVAYRVLPGHHLRIDVRFHAVDLADVFQVGGRDLAVVR